MIYFLAEFDWKFDISKVKVLNHSLSENHEELVIFSIFLSSCILFNYFYVLVKL